MWIQIVYLFHLEAVCLGKVSALFCTYFLNENGTHLLELLGDLSEYIKVPSSVPDEYSNFPVSCFFFSIP